MRREDIKNFWFERANVDLTTLPRIESIVNLQTDKEIADTYVKEEIDCINKHLVLNQDDIVLDLGAGAGRWSVIFAKKVKKVYAVEFSEKFIELAKEQAALQEVSNIEFHLAAVEDFVADFPVTQIYISGVLSLLDNEQYEQLTNAIKSYAPQGCKLFLREGVSMTGEEYESDNSARISTDQFTCLYRTPEQHIEAFEKAGFEIDDHGLFFDEDSVLNKIRKPESRLYYLSFTKA